MEMQQLTLLSLFHEYLTLEIPPHLPYKNIDIELGELMISRWGCFYCEVINLLTGECIRFQKDLISLCYGFYSSRGEEIVRLKETPGSPLWSVIVVSVRIITRSPIDPSRLKSTKEIREWLKSTHKIDIEPITYKKNGEIIIL